MGIKEFLRKTKIEKKKNIADYKGKTIAVDTYSWIHKGMYTCGEEVLSRNDITGIFAYFKSKINKMLSLDIKVVLVFDGDKLNLKGNTESNREENRKKIMDKINLLKRKGNQVEAGKLYSQAIDVTPEMALCLKEKLEEEFPYNLEFIVAPYEADSELAYLSKIGYVDVIISEDSDLLIFGGKVMFYKMDNQFNGDEVKLDELQNCENFDFKNWTHDEIICFAILCGCDYLDSPKQVKFSNAYKLFSKTKSIKSCLTELQGKIDDDYLGKFACAYLCFKYQRVYCPVQKKMKALNPFEDKDEDFRAMAFSHYKSYSFLGEMIHDPTLSDLVNFRICPITKKEFRSDKQYLVKRSKNYESRKRLSIKKSNDKLSLGKGQLFAYKLSLKKEVKETVLFQEFDNMNNSQSKTTEVINSDRKQSHRKFDWSVAKNIRTSNLKSTQLLTKFSDFKKQEKPIPHIVLAKNTIANFKTNLGFDDENPIQNNKVIHEKHKRDLMPRSKSILDVFRGF